MKHYKITRSKWTYILVGPILSLIAFVVTFYLDPLNFGEHEPLAAIPAFLFSVVILLIHQGINTSHEVQKTSLYSDRIYEAIKNYLHVTPLGSPERAMQYINSRTPILREVKNTSFNLVDEMERADEKFYDTKTYKEMRQKIKIHASKNLLWKDIGDSLAVQRFRDIHSVCDSFARGKKHGYKYRLINHEEPQINFIILEYVDGSREVLFNWDFRGIGQDPNVLISRDRQIIELFAVQFAHLWRRASPDHDSMATKSTSTK